MDDQGSKGVERKRYLFALAVTLILGALSLLRAEIPRFAVMLLLAGCSIFIWLVWEVTARYRAAFRIAVVIVLLAISAYLSWQIYPVRKPDGPEAKQTVPTTSLPPVESPRIPPPPKQIVSQDVTVVLYNDANDPQFSVDGRPSSPTRYSSGIATFRLEEGTHLVRAEYSTRTCSATVSVPLSDAGPVPANCSLNRVGGE
jgi:hypothetical protein